MKRSEVNRAIGQAITVFYKHGIGLPPWAIWGPRDWEAHAEDAKALRDAWLGWDVTDFGMGDSAAVGLTALHLRNGGSTVDPSAPYRESLLVFTPGQAYPWHTRVATYDITSRAGGQLVVEIAHADASGEPGRDPLDVHLDGMTRRMTGQGILVLEPGQSVRVPAGVRAQISAGQGAEPLICSEIASAGDPLAVCLLSAGARIPSIQEDEAARFPLIWEMAGRTG